MMLNQTLHISLMLTYMYMMSSFIVKSKVAYKYDIYEILMETNSKT